MKKAISIFLAFALIISAFSGVPTVVSAADKAVTATPQGTYTKSAETQEVVIRIETPGVTEDYCTFGIANGVTLPEGFKIKSFSTNNTSPALSGGNYNILDSAWGTETYGTLTYEGADGENTISADAYYDATILVPANAAGTFSITFNNVRVFSDYGSKQLAIENEVVATITISEPAAPAADYEIYYELDSDEDVLDATGATGADGFMEYDVADDVTATVYMKNNTQANVTMQAYDIYLDYSEKLIYAGNTLEGAVAYAEGKETAFDEEKDTVVDHIQLVKGTQTIALESGEAVELGTIMFSFADGAAFDEELEITLVDAADANNSEKAEDVTNFSVGGTDEGDATSYYPVDVSAVLGAEINTIYTVTYDANGGTFAEGAVTSQEKQHNIDLTLEPGTPTRDGYSFLGWSEDAKATEPTYTTEEGKNVYTTNAATTLYAVWQQNTKTITFNANDGSDTPATETQTVNHGVATVLDANTFNRTGYTFAGWNTEADGSGTAYADKASITITEDTTLYAQWTINKYTVTWYNYDGTQLHKDENVEYGATPVYDGQTPTKPDSVDGQFAYTHDGWSATQGGAKLDPLPAVDGNEEFYALFAETTKSYNVTFDAGEGSFAADADTEVTVEYGQKPNAQDIPAPTAPDGYEFTGWSDGTKTYSKDLSDFTVTGEVELTAQYAAAEYVITLDPDGGAVSDMTADEDGKYTITYTITSTDKLPAATKTGYAFDGWKLATKTDGWEAKTYGANTPVTGMWGDVELVAQWSEDKHTVMQSDSVQNGTATPDKQSAKEDDTITVTVKPDEGYKFGENDKVTYTYTDAEGTTHNIQITVSDDDGDGVFTGTFPMVDYNVEINATFTAIDYTVNANANPSGFATVTPDKTTANINDEITLTISDVKDGYQLKNYTVTNDSTDETITVTNGKFTMPAANVTVTANLEGKSYQIIYDANGGENTMNPGNGTFGTETTLVKNSFAKTGYTFVGWTTTEGGTTVEYTEEAGFNPETYAEGYTLYAVWQVNTYKITVQDSSNGSVATNATDNDAVAYGTTVTLIATPDAGYQLGQYTVKDSNNADVPVTNGQFTMPASDVTVSATFTLVAYDVNLDNSDTTEGTVSANVEKATMGTVVTLSNTPANGYELDKYTVTYKDADGNDQPITVTDGQFTMPASDVTVKASFKPAMYTITYDLDGGSMPGQVEPNYDITDTLVLPKPTKLNYTFKGWKVTKADGNWAADAVIDTNNLTVSGKWGDVTLTAQWDIGFTYSVESYTYAKTGYKMLRIATADNTNAYKFGEETMYYTDNAHYVTINGGTYEGVFVTLIPINDGATVLVTDDNKLTDAAMQMITQSNGAATVIARDGDVNGDEVVNIADANVVYQMVQNGGSYYGNLGNESQSDILSRLEADMHTETNGEDLRGTLDDVDVIVNDINGTN